MASHDGEPPSEEAMTPSSQHPFEAAARWLEATADYDGPWSIKEIVAALRSVEVHHGV